MVEPVPGRLDSAPADEPVPVSPPVDALLKLLDEYSDEIEYGTAAEAACDTAQWAIYDAAAKETRSSIQGAIRALWAAGVEEGRRQAHREVLDELDRRGVHFCSAAGCDGTPNHD